jgi:hypothetical protein
LKAFPPQPKTKVIETLRVIVQDYFRMVEEIVAGENVATENQA